MARTRKKQQPPENHDRWLITYADLITLLLIFFVVMYAMSQVDASKYEALSKALNMQFQQGDSIVPQTSEAVGVVAAGQLSEESVSQKDELEQQLEDLLKKVQTYVEQNGLEGSVSATDSRRGVAVTLNDLFLFDLGKADLKPEAYPILNQLATLFPTLDATISIEGHTDNLPLATGSYYKDNWGLSQARSLSVLRYFVDQKNLDSQKFVSTAYADNRPVAPNTTEANRSKNRRVEIVVLREKTNAN